MSCFMFISPVMEERTNTVTRCQKHDYGSIHCYSYKVAPTGDILV